MIYPSVRRTVGAVVLAAFVVTTCGAAEQPRSAVPSAKAVTPSTTKSGTARPGAKGPLPDPTLLDGSTLPAEKKSEHGMIGDFELPGDDSRSGKVGGPPGAPGQGGQQQQQPPGVSVSLPPIPGVGLPLPMPAGGAAGLPSPAGSAGLPDPSKQGAAGAAQANAGMIPPAGAGGESAPGGQQSQGAGGAPAGGEAGKAEGMQVGGLQGEAGAGGDTSGGPNAKPSAVSIGDSTMRIEPSANAPAAGSQNPQVAGQTQQHEKGTGSGGKGTGGAGSGNRAEKGRAIPTGL